MSTLPNSSSALRIRPCAWLSSVTSQTAASTRPPPSPIRSTRSVSRSSLLAATTTAAPSRRQRLGRRLADAARSAGDHCDLAVQLRHILSLSLVVCLSSLPRGGERAWARRGRCRGRRRWRGREAQVGERPVGVREGAYGARRPRAAVGAGSRPLSRQRRWRAVE